MLLITYLLIIGLLGIPTLFFLLYMNVAALSFEGLGLSAAGAFLLFAASLAGSVVNIPLSSREIVVRGPKIAAIPSFRRTWAWGFPGEGGFFRSGDFPWFFIEPPVVQKQVLAVNLGGALIPAGFSIYLLCRSQIVPVVLATTLVSAACYVMARPTPGRGILIPSFVPPLSAALAAMLFARDNPSAVAYIAGTMGTLIGADIFHIGTMMRTGPGVLSIGGAGVYDGIFLAGLIAAFLTRG